MKSTETKQYNVKFKQHVIGFITAISGATLTEVKKVDTIQVNGSDAMQDFLDKSVDEFEVDDASKSLYLAKGDDFVGYFNSKYNVAPDRLQEIWKKCEFAENAPKS